MKRAFVHTVSCLARQLDAIAIKNFLSENGWQVVDDHKKADLVLIGTCGVTKKREDSSIDAILRYKKNKSDSEVVVFGCLPAINHDRIRSVFDGEIIDLGSIEKLNEITEAKIGINRFKGNFFDQKPSKIHFLKDKIRGLGNKRFGEKNYYITLSIGCLGNCSYCTTKNAIGDLKSRPIEEILCDFDTGLKLGYKRFVLCASDTGAYGRDIGTDITSLLKKIFGREGDYRISLTYFNPRWCNDIISNMTDFFKSGKIDFISLPVQSGSNRILEFMNRNYTVEDFEMCIKHLKDTNPRLTISTDIIYGFPGETEEDFRKTLRLLDNPRINSILPTFYSERPKTKKFPKKMRVPHHIKKSRETRIYIRFYWNKTKRFLDNYLNKFI